MLGAAAVGMPVALIPRHIQYIDLPHPKVGALQIVFKTHPITSSLSYHTQGEMATEK
jgi:hypothetical protein